MGGALEIVDTSCGALVKAGDAAALADELLRLIEDPERRAALGGRGRERARELCDPGTQMNRIAAVLGSVVRSRAVAH
jgi:glycosyltransferase involved in cell wall biosynthesis